MSRLAAIFALLILAIIYLPEGASAMPLNLLPYPKEVRLGAEGARFAVGTETRLFLPAQTERPEWLAVQDLLAALEQHGGVTPVLDRTGQLSPPAEPAIFLRVLDIPFEDPLSRQGYRLEISPDAVRLTGHSNAGLLYGLRTLTQLAEQFGAELPALVIEDAPDFIHRGFYHDITRGKVPTLATLKEIVDYLAAHKVNEFQLYVEHTFMFRFDPEIAQNPYGLTAAEVLELDQYCRDRRIAFVPSLQSFGHMGAILSMDRYRHLADVEIEQTWDEMTWHERMVGATLDTSSEEAWDLLRRMHDEYLPLFSAPYVNVCADETYDVGKGKTQALAEEMGGAGRLYLSHMERLNDTVKGYGKRMMFWGDIVKKHPELVPEIPKDAILLNWGYWRETDFESCKLFADAGLDFYVCPGTSGWNRLIHGMNNADLNIRRYAAAGKKYGAIGLLNTNWGDRGHINTLGAALHGISLGAAMAWNTEAPASPEFDRIWDERTFQMTGGEATAVLRRVARASDTGSTWLELYSDWDDEKVYRHLDRATAEHLIADSRAAESVLARYQELSPADPRMLRELLWSVQMSELVGQKGVLVAELQETGTLTEESKARAREFANRLETVGGELREIWLARNKESELHEVEEAIAWTVEKARELAME